VLGAPIDHNTDYLYYDFRGVLQSVQTKSTFIPSIPDALSKDRLHSEWLMPSLRKLQMSKLREGQKVKILDARNPVFSGPEYSMNFRIAGRFTFFSPVHSQGLGLRYSDNIRLLL
jgi:hypothetical protein